jgi:hypothetical protein
MDTTREQIIATLKTELEKNPAVYALWLEGADSTDSKDEYSDIDLVADAKDGEEESVISAIRGILSRLGTLDFDYRGPNPNDFLRHMVFHIAGTPEQLTVDVDIQSHSRDFSFIEGDAHEKPFVLFDKSGVLKFKKVDPGTTKNDIEERLCRIKAEFYLRTKVRKYVERNKFLEAVQSYHRYVLQPIVELLRIKHTPTIADYYLVHISDHLPQTVVSSLEDLYRVTSCKEIAKRLPKAERLFEDALKEIEK